MSNLLIEIGNTALKASWSDRMTLGKTFRYQGEKYMDFILSLTAREKPAVMVVCSAFPLSEQESECLRAECDKFLILDRNNRDLLLKNGLPSYLSYDRAASIAASRYLFKGRGCFKALQRYSKALPLVEIPQNPDQIGQSEVSSIESGVVSGILFEIEGYLNLHPENIVVFTGGDANYFAKRLKSSIFVICNLVLMGLALMADEYAQS